jgi:pimeloyl-ACP methyl ester carboxylesterase
MGCRGRCGACAPASDFGQKFGACIWVLLSNGSFLMVPVSIVVGADDRLIKAKSQSMRLHENIPGSALHVIPGIGHMVHHGAPAEVMRAIEASCVKRHDHKRVKVGYLPRKVFA